MSAVADIIAKWPNKADLARDLGLKRISHIHTMRVRMSIDSLHWTRMVESAKRRKIRGVSLATLAAAHEADAVLRAEMSARRRRADAAEPARASA